MWTPFNYFIGTWHGSGQGRPGHSRVQRQYQFVLGGQFLQVQNRSIYDPQDKSPDGEVHEDWGLIGYDRTRQVFVFRQFHVEGFVSQYVLDSLTDNGQTIRFITEGIENIPTSWRARETYRKLSEDEFVEVFELAEPGKDFAVYTENHLQRVQSGLMANRSMPPGAIIPELAYGDVGAAVAWLCQTFGFSERLRIGRHRSQLVFGEASVIVVAQDGGRAPRAPDAAAFQPLQGEVAHSVMVRVADVDRHHEHVKRCGARILNPPETYPFGERQYTVQDVGGHRWTFTQSVADVAPEEWGGQSTRPQ